MHYHEDTLAWEWHTWTQRACPGHTASLDWELRLLEGSRGQQWDPTLYTQDVPRGNTSLRGMGERLVRKVLHAGTQELSQDLRGGREHKSNEPSRLNCIQRGLEAAEGQASDFLGLRQACSAGIWKIFQPWCQAVAPCIPTGCKNKGRSSLLVIAEAATDSKRVRPRKHAPLAVHHLHGLSLSQHFPDQNPFRYTKNR